MAVEEINAAGGILKQKIALSQLDTQTNPGVARSQMQKAIDGDPEISRRALAQAQIDLARAQEATA